MEFIISETEWKIIEILSQGSTSPSEIAKKLKITLPGVSNEIKKLKEKKIVKEIAKKSGKRRPFKIYALNEFVFLIKALNKDTDKLFLEIDENLKIHLNIWKIPQREFQYFIEKFWWQIEQLVIKENIELISVGIFGSVAKGNARQGSDIDVLIIIKSESKDELKILEKSIAIESKEKKVKIILPQVFSETEFREACEKGKFAREILKDLIIIYDPNNFLTDIKNEFTERAS